MTPHLIAKILEETAERQIKTLDTINDEMFGPVSLTDERPAWYTRRQVEPEECEGDLPRGWQCPVCAKVYAPSVKACEGCNKS